MIGCLVIFLFSFFGAIEAWCRPNERADIVFVFEESYSTGELFCCPSEWNYQKDLLDNLVGAMYIDYNNGIRVGGVTYNTVPTIRFYLDTYQTKSAIQNGIQSITTDRRSWLYENDTDYIYKGLQTAYDSVFTASRGDRPDVPNYYIFTTDSVFSADNPYNTGSTIRGAGNNYIWAIGVKSAASQSKLRDAVHGDGKYFTGSSFKALSESSTFAEEFWYAFRGCPLTDPAIGKYYCFLVPLLYFEEPASADASTEVCEQDEGMMFLMLDALYEINCCGIITSWEFYPCATGQIEFMVWSKKSGTTYELKAIQIVEVIDSDLNGTVKAINFTIPEEERIAIVADDRIGWRVSTKNIISYKPCSYLEDRYCPQNIHRTQILGTGSVYEHMQFDWAASSSNTSTVQKIVDRGYSIKVYANNNTQLNFEETFYLTSAADHWPVGTSFSSYAFTGQDYKENLTITWQQGNAYIDLNESFSYTQVAKQLEPSESPQGLAGYKAVLKAVDTCRWTASATFSVETFNGPPIITNFPKEMEVWEDQGGSELIYDVAVYDPTVPPDAVCCTLESVRPQTLNFEIKLINGSKFKLYTYEKPIFDYNSWNSYMLTVCCEDGFGTVKGMLKIDVKQIKEKETYEPPSWFFQSVIISLVPIGLMFLFSCCLLYFSMFCSTSDY